MKEFPREGKCLWNEELYKFLKRTRKVDFGSHIPEVSTEGLSWNENTVRWCSTLYRVKKPEYTWEQLKPFINPSIAPKRYVKILTDNPSYTNTNKDHYYELLIEEEHAIYFLNNQDNKVGLTKGYGHFEIVDNKPIEVKMENKELTIDDLVENEVYVFKGTEQYRDYTFIYKHKKCHLCVDSDAYMTKYPWNFKSCEKPLSIRLATQEEKQWMEACITADKFIPKEEALKPKYAKIKSERTQSQYEVTLDDKLEYGANPSKTHLWELMPEGFIPPIVEPPKFIEGSWYKCSEWSITIAAKCTKTSNTEFSYDQYISSELKYDKSTRTRHLDKYIKIPLSEIQQYLPEDHPDKIKVDVIPEYVECIKEDSGIVIGNIYEVQLEKGFQYEDNLKLVYFINDRPYYQDHFKQSTKEAYEAQFVSKQENTMTKFKHGDKVRILNRHPNNKTGDTKWMYDAKGCIGYICNYNDDKYVIHSNSNSSGEYYGMLDRNNKDLGYFLDSDLELVVDEKANIPEDLTKYYFKLSSNEEYQWILNYFSNSGYKVFRGFEFTSYWCYFYFRNQEWKLSDQKPDNKTLKSITDLGYVKTESIFGNKESQVVNEYSSQFTNSCNDIPLMSSPTNEDKQTKSIVLWTAPKGTEEIKKFVPLVLKQIKKQVLWQS